jgi:undecaprenyl diphosphate synthase
VEIQKLFTFSQENWSRPAAEVDALMKLLRRFARQEREELRRQGVAVHVLGDLTGLRRRRAERSTRSSSSLPAAGRFASTS